MLSHRNNLFQEVQDYEDFALYAASCTMMRYRNPKQEEGKIKKIKSILNWSKRALYGLSVNFRNRHFRESIDESTIGEEGVSKLKQEFNHKVINSQCQMLGVEIEEYFLHLPRTIKEIIKKSPYGKLKALSHNIYLSVLISFLSSISLSNRNKERLAKGYFRSASINDLINNIYKEESLYNVTLYHLP